MTDCATQLWSQLCLDASLTIHGSNKLLISLSAQSSSNADVRPPKYAPSACLEDLGMTFHFSTCRRTRSVSRAQVALPGSGIQHTFASTTPVDGNLDRHYYSPLSSPGGSKGVLDILTDGHARWILGASSVATSPVSSQSSVSFSMCDESSLDTPTTRHRYATQEVKLEILVQLMDFSLRRMISDYRPVRTGGVILSSDAGCPKLAAISPALFSPGYVKAVSQRTDLLPMIARTVSRVYRRTNSSRLRHKLKRLQESSLSSYLDHGSNEDFDSSSAMSPSSVEVRLWFLTRSKLIDPFACRCLKSLGTFNKTGLGSYEMLDDLLDDVGDEMLDRNEAPAYDAYGDAMELDEANHLDLFQEHFPDGTSEEVEKPLDNDLFWEHSQDEVAYDSGETVDGDIASSAHDEHAPSSAGHLQSNLSVM